MATLKQVLPRDVAVQLVVKWYVARNAPGTQDIAPSQEWRLFLGVLLGEHFYTQVKKTPISCQIISILFLFLRYAWL